MLEKRSLYVWVDPRYIVAMCYNNVKGLRLWWGLNLKFPLCIIEAIRPDSKCIAAFV